MFAVLEQDVPVPTVQVMVVVDPFLSTVTTPELALTPPVPAVTDKFRKVPARVMGTPADTVVEVQVPMAKVPRPCSPSVEEAVAVPVQAPWRICDPAFTRKAREGRTESIRLCISCNQYCIGRMGLNLSLGCIQTPATGNELRFPPITLLPKTQSRRPIVLVVGGGPAGMQAAKVAAQRGFRVKLYERQHELGGQINLIVRVPSRVEFGDASRNLQFKRGPDRNVPD